MMMQRRQETCSFAVPTNDLSVRTLLRRLDEPATVYGEKEGDRRERLTHLMNKLHSEEQLENLIMKSNEDEQVLPDEEDIEYPFFTEGSARLREARLDIEKYSIEKAALRIHRAKTQRDEEAPKIFNWDLISSKSPQDIDKRPLSGCSLSPDGSTLVTCSLSGAAMLWRMPQVERVASLKGHTDRATDVAFSPTGDHLATASADKTAKLWSKEGSLLHTYEGHLDRLARIAFHPSGRYLGTTSFDWSWRLWHVETGEELLLQEGHSRGVHGISFQSNGSLAASCGRDALVRVWDLRSGRNILDFQGHCKPVLCLDFSPNGYHLASGGEDNACQVWDLRRCESLRVIPAHSSLVTQVRFESQQGCFLATASCDSTAKLWSASDFKPIKTLSGHRAMVTSVDIAADGQYIATVSHDRTINPWSAAARDEEEEMMHI